MKNIKRVISVLLMIAILSGVFSICSFAVVVEGLSADVLTLLNVTNESVLSTKLQSYVENYSNIKEIRITGTENLTSIAPILTEQNNNQTLRLETITVTNAAISSLPVATAYSETVFNTIKSFKIRNNNISFSFENINIFPNLKNLIAKNSEITSISGIENLKNLTSLDLSDNNIIDVSSIGLMDYAINNLNLNNNLISNIYPLGLANNAQKRKYDKYKYSRLSLEGNYISDVGALYDIYFIDTTSRKIDLENNFINASSVNEKGYEDRLHINAGVSWNPKTMPTTPYFVDDGTIIGYYGTETNLNIPSSINGENITSIGESAFRNNLYIETVTIPSTVSSIGDFAFYRCLNINGIDFPQNLSSLGKYACASCVNLRDVVIPYSLQSPGDKAFCNCYRMKNVCISNPRFILSNVFYGCNSSGYTELNFNLNDDVINYNGAYEITTYIANAGYTYSSDFEVQNKVLTGCTSNENVIEIPNGINSINVSSYYGSAESIIVPYGVSSLISFGDTQLSDVTIVIPNTVTSISNSFVSNSSNVTIY